MWNFISHSCHISFLAKIVKKKITLLSHFFFSQKLWKKMWKNNVNWMQQIVNGNMVWKTHCLHTSIPQWKYEFTLPDFYSFYCKIMFPNVNSHFRNVSSHFRNVNLHVVMLNLQFQVWWKYNIATVPCSTVKSPGENVISHFGNIYSHFEMWKSHFEMWNHSSQREGSLPEL